MILSTISLQSYALRAYRCGKSILRGVDIYLIRVKMQSGEFTVGLWLPNWHSKVDDPFIGSTCAHSTRRIQWLKYKRISTRPNPRPTTRMSGTFYWCGLFVAPIFRFLLCVRAHTRFSIFHPTDRIVSFAPPSGTATLPVFATRSPISPLRSTLFRAAFPPSRTPSFPHPPHVHNPSSSFEYLCRAASRHPFASVIPSANFCAKRGFALRKAYSAYSRHLLSGALLEDRRRWREFTEDSRSRVCLLTWLSVDDILAEKGERLAIPINWVFSNI